MQATHINIFSGERVAVTSAVHVDEEYVEYKRINPALIFNDEGRISQKISYFSKPRRVFNKCYKRV